MRAILIIAVLCFTILGCEGQGCNSKELGTATRPAAPPDTAPLKLAITATQSHLAEALEGSGKIQDTMKALPDQLTPEMRERAAVWAKQVVTAMQAMVDDPIKSAMEESVKASSSSEALASAIKLMVSTTSSIAKERDAAMMASADLKKQVDTLTAKVNDAEKNKIIWFSVGTLLAGLALGGLAIYLKSALVGTFSGVCFAAWGFLTLVIRVYDWIPYVAAGGILLLVLALGYYLWIHRGALVQVTQTLDAVKGDILTVASRVGIPAEATARLGATLDGFFAAKTQETQDTKTQVVIQGAVPKV
jgi:hypothetical protein